MTTTMTEEQPPPFEEISHTRSITHVSSGTEVELQVNGEYTYTAHGAIQMPGVSVPFEGLNEEEEELPQYVDIDAVDVDAPTQLPVYEERHLLGPVVSYTFYQISRKLQVLTPATRATFNRPRYRISTRSGPSMFSKKADFTLTRLPTGAAVAAENSPGKDVGFINFDRTGPLPWMPRATVQILADSLDSASGKKTSYNMSSPNFSDWMFKMNNELYFWRLTDKPTALSLIEHSSSSIVARFTYGAQGTDATRGAEVGVLDIFGGSRSEDTEIIELVLSTCQVPVNHWKNMGRHYKNNVTPRNCSVIGPVTHGNSFFEDSRNTGRRRASNVV